MILGSIFYTTLCRILEISGSVNVECERHLLFPKELSVTQGP